MVLISPSILSADFGFLAQELKALEQAGADEVHMDIMDGHFVPNIALGPMMVDVIHRLTSLPLDVHLMVSEPEKWVEVCIQKGAKNITIHYEASKNLDFLIQKIKSLGAKCGVSLKPNTPILVLDPFLEALDRVLVMTVEPGFSGQTLLPEAVHKIEDLRKMRALRGYAFQIQVDGGVDGKNAAFLRTLGADILVSGSFIFQSSNYQKAVETLRDN